MEDKQVNTFSKGMNVDIDRSVLPNTMYPYAKNLRLYENGESFIARDILGNSQVFKFPKIQSLYYITEEFTIPDDINQTFTISVGPLTYSYSISFAEGDGIQTLATALMQIDMGITVKYNANRLIITYIGEYPMSVSATVGNLVVEQIHGPIITYRVIGDVTERNETILFTVGGGMSQIWSMVDNAITLLYDGDLGFKENNLIYAKTFSYNESTLKLYWVDGVKTDSNYFRQCNVREDMLLAKIAEDFVIITKEFLPRPVIVELTSGYLKAGVVQYAYQLYNQYGAQTHFSQPTYLINLSEDSHWSGSSTYFRGTPKGEDTGKGVRCTISNIPEGFGYIKVVRIFYDTMNGTPVIDYISDEKCPTDGTYKFVDSGLSIEALSMEDFNILGRYNFKAKDIETKDNMLFAANIIEDYTDVNYDARAYRYQKIGAQVGSDQVKYEGYIKDTQGGSIWLDGRDIENMIIPDDHDCIQTKTDQMTQKWNAITGNLGGSGPNISYEFKALYYKIDDSTDPERFIVSKKTASELSPEQQLGLTDATVNNSFFGYPSPYFKQYVGYQSGEVYRFGIRFKKGSLRTFVKWIADIKIPHPNETDYKVLYTINGVSVRDYRPYYAVPNRQLNDTVVYGLAFFPEFTVRNVPDGWEYEIVANPRLEGDRTVVAAGTTYGVFWDKDNINEVITTEYVDGAGLTPFEVALSDLSKVRLYRRFDSAEVLYNHTNIYPGDKLNTYGVVAQSLYDGTSWVRKDKSINMNAPFVGSYTIEESWAIHKQDVVSDDEITIEGISSRNDYGWVGRTNILRLDSWLVDPESSLLIYILNAFYALIERDLVSQYAGPGYYNRVNSEYTSRYQLDTTTGTRIVFDGDVYMAYHDRILLSKAENNETTPKPSFLYSAGTATVNPAYITSEQYHETNNVWLQETNGVRVINSEARTQDDDYYVYNTAYSIENRIELCYQQPLFFEAIVHNDTRIIGSDLKQSDNVIDTWLIFRPNVYIDAQKPYGPINAIRIYNNRLYAFQDKGVCVPSINERQVMNENSEDNSPLGLVIGVGGILSRIDYVSTFQGTMHQKSVLTTPYGIFFYDGYSKSIMSIGNGFSSISDLKGLKAKLATNSEDLNDYDNPGYSYGVNGFYDIANRELVYTFKDLLQSYTVAFTGGVFNSYHDYTSDYYFTQNNKVYSVHRKETEEGELVYQHNTGQPLVFYDVQSTFEIMLYINRMYSVKKTFDGCVMNLHMYNSESHQFNDFFTRLQAYNDYQNTGVCTFVLKQPTDIYPGPQEVYFAKRDRTWSFYFPRNSVSAYVSSNPNIQTELDYSKAYSERLKDKYLIVHLIYEGTNELHLPFIMTKFRY